MAKAICTPGEFERILVLASAETDTHNRASDLIPALEASGTPHAIVWLVEYLGKAWPEDLATANTKAAKAALVRLGKRAHPKLLMELGRTAKGEPKVQLLFWTNILDIISQTGDAACLPSQ